MRMPHGAVGLIGAGALSDALAGGLLAAGLAADRLWVCNRSDDGRLERFRAAGLRTTRAKSEVAGACETLLLLVKPRDAGAALGELRGLVRPAHRILSCMAGISTAYIEAALGNEPRVLRAMPNIGSAVRASATALCGGRHSTPGDLEAAVGLLQAVGEVVCIDEARMDAATAVAGSGPAYVYALVEAMAKAAQGLGLSDADARRLILHTVAGAARLALETGRAPAALRAAVSSPGGTTLAGLAVLEQAGFEATVVAALHRAAERSHELGREWTGG